MVRILHGSFLFFIIFSLILLSSCSARRQFAPGEIPQISDVSAEDEQYGHEVLNMMMQEYKLDTDAKNNARVQEIVDKLVLSANSHSAPWHVYVFADDTVENAAATRGNHIFVWTGILKKVLSDDELSAVLAHELAHVLAGHTSPDSGEEFAKIFSEVTGQVAAEVLSSQGQIGVVADLAASLTQLLINSLIVNPEEQRKELEADQIGLYLMAKANYDPQTSVDFWERMQKEGFGDMGPVQFFSSHPSSDERLEQLRTLLPEAQKLRLTQSGDPQDEYKSEWTIQNEQKIKTKSKPKQEKAKPKVTPTVASTPKPAIEDQPKPW